MAVCVAKTPVLHLPPSVAASRAVMRCGTMVLRRVREEVEAACGSMPERLLAALTDPELLAGHLGAAKAGAGEEAGAAGAGGGGEEGGAEDGWCGQCHVYEVVVEEDDVVAF